MSFDYQEAWMKEENASPTEQKEKLRKGAGPRKDEVKLRSPAKLPPPLQSKAGANGRKTITS